MELLGQLLVNGVYIGSIYALYGLSFATIFAPTKIWHFAQGGVYAAGAYAVYVLNVHAGWPLALAALGAAALTALAGAACDRLLYRPLAARGASHMVVVMASLGLFIVIENVLALGFGSSGRSIAFISGAFELGPLLVTHIQWIAPLVSLAVVGGFVLLLHRSTLGRHLRALVTNDELLEINGVEARRLKMLAFALGSALLPIAAAMLMASGAGAAPTMGITAVLTGAMAMFLGGVDNFLGAAAAGFLIGIIENICVWIVPTEWQVAVTYGILLLVIMAKPTGLFGRGLQKATV
jgi:branched-chain amino acid transport system permease protein